MQQTLLSRKELSERWGISTTCVINYEESWIITRIKDIPVPRYSLDEILKIEQTDMSETSPLVVRELKSKIRQLEYENSKLRKRLDLIRQALL